MRSGATVDSLDKLINESICINNELYEFKLESRAFQPKTAVENKPRYNKPNHGQRRNAWKPRHPSTYQSNRPEPMHLDNIQGKKDYKPKKDDVSETRKCYNCSKAGYLAQNCRSKNKVTRQLNMLTGPLQEDAEEWTVVHRQYQVERKDDVLTVEAGTADIREEG
jgi:hypothetical protein